MSSVAIVRRAVLFMMLLAPAGFDGLSAQAAEPAAPSVPAAAPVDPAEPQEHLYTATAKFQRLSDTLEQSDPVVPKAYERIRSMLTYNIKGRPAIEQLIYDLNLAQGPRFPRMEDGEFTPEARSAFNALIDELSKAIEISHDVDEPEVELISITVHHKNLDLVAPLANKIVENYLRNVRKALDDTLLDQKKLFDGEVIRYGRKVQELEQARMRFMLNSGGIEPNDPLEIHNTLAALKDRKSALEAAYEKRKQKVAELDRQHEAEPDFIEGYKQVNERDVEMLRLTVSTLKDTYIGLVGDDGVAADHPSMKRMLERIRDAEAKLALAVDPDKRESQKQPNPRKQSLHEEILQKAGELESVEKELVALSKQVERYEILNRNFFVVRSEYLKVTREMKDAHEQLDYWSERLREVQRSLTFAVSDRGMRLSVMQRAVEPDAEKK